MYSQLLQTSIRLCFTVCWSNTPWKTVGVGVNVTRSNDTVFWIPSSEILTVLSDTLAFLNGLVMWPVLYCTIWLPVALQKRLSLVGDKLNILSSVWQLWHIKKPSIVAVIVMSFRRFYPLLGVLCIASSLCTCRAFNAFGDVFAIV